MDKSKKFKSHIIFISIVFISCAIISALSHNKEFLYYNLTTLVLFLLFVRVYRERFVLNQGLFFGVDIGIVLHNLGGNVYSHGIRLYEFWIIPGIFRYDNLVHTFNIIIITFAIYAMISVHFEKKFSKNKSLQSIILIMMAMGVGATYEILELLAVLFLNAGPQVGNYLNNAFDLVFNLLGATIAAMILARK